ncbi:MAG: NHL repeat-containing protein [Acidobacteriota bacterium]|nr:MAG: NHL repeat-containing protein [Acidobacteriota bacterium]
MLYRAPGRIAVDVAGNVYATEPALGRIVVTNRFGGVIDVRDGFQTPSSIAIDHSGHIYVGERHTGAVSVFDAAWNLRRRLGQGTGEFVMPNDIAIDPDALLGQIYVADSEAHVVRVYAPTGEPQFAFGGPGSDPGSFDFPAAIHVSTAGEIFVADQNNDRVQVFDRAGGFLRCFGRRSSFSFSRKFGSLLGLAGDALGRVYVADAFRGHVQVFDAQGVALGPIGEFGDGPGQLRTPVGLAIDPFSRLLVASVNTGRVARFGLDAFSDPACGSDADCPSNDGDPCTIETCVDGLCQGASVESAACGSCDDCFDTDRDGLVDSDDTDCSTLRLEAPYGLLATAAPPAPGLVLDRQSYVVALPGNGKCPPGVSYPSGPSRAQVCSSSVVLGNDVRIDGDQADPVLCQTARQHLPALAAYVAGLTVTNETVDDMVVDRSAAQSPCVQDSTSMCPTVTFTLGSGLQVLAVESVVIERGAQVVLAGQPDTVLVVRVLGGIEVGARAAIVVTGGLTANRVLWQLEGPGSDVVLGDSAWISGTVLAAGRGIQVERRAEVRGALLGKRVTLGPKSGVKHAPFVGLLVP